MLLFHISVSYSLKTAIPLSLRPSFGAFLDTGKGTSINIVVSLPASAVHGPSVNNKNYGFQHTVKS
jgi:hypothetical protein